MMKVMMLGGGTNQLCAIKRIIERGDEVVVSDYLESSPGKALATYTALADTFSYEESLEQARKHKVDAILTVGTDQPVLTAAKVAERLDLPTGIDSETALAVTNKKHMKRIFKEHRIPTVRYEVFNESHMAGSGVSEVLKNFSYPAVLKPVDSQGQRGIFKVYSPENALEKIPETMRHSKSKEALIEAYYENQEVTVSGWVDSGKTYILTMTDRVTFVEDEKIGVCVSHEHPSVHIDKYGETAKVLTENIVDAFGIKDGPIYFQFLVGADGMVVNEIACRIGGAYEDQFIPRITGFDILGAQLDLVQGRRVSVECLEDYDFRKNEKCVSVQLFFASPGRVKRVSAKEEIVKLEGVDDYRCHYKPADEIPVTENASARAGFGLIFADSEEEICERINLFFNTLKIDSVKGENLVIKGCRGNRQNENKHKG